MTTSSLVDSFDWDMFSNSDDGNNIISFEEMFEVTEVSTLPDQLESCPSVEDSIRTFEPLNVFEQGNDNYHLQDADTFMKLEDFFDSNSTPSQSTVDSQNLSWSNSSLSTSSPSIPEFDQLQNLPYEIVERPRYIPSTQINL